jgi:hypothetical protein
MLFWMPGGIPIPVSDTDICMYPEFSLLPIIEHCYFREH